MLQALIKRTHPTLSAVQTSQFGTLGRSRCEIPNEAFRSLILHCFVTAGTSRHFSLRGNLCLMKEIPEKPELRHEVIPYRRDHRSRGNTAWTGPRRKVPRWRHTNPGTRVRPFLSSGRSLRETAGRRVPSPNGGSRRSSVQTLETKGKTSRLSTTRTGRGHDISLLPSKISAHHLTRN